MFRIVASVVVMVCIIAAWIISGDGNITDTKPAENASPKTEQAPAQSKPANPGDKKFNF